LYISGAGLYSWFQNFDQSCVDRRNCQKSLIELSENGPGIQIYNFISIGAEQMLYSDKYGELAATQNAASSGHPYWSHISVYRPKYEKATDPPPSSKVPDLAVSPVSNADMNAMLNSGGEQKGIAIALGAVP
jgi:hypothetical protein